ncbi:HPr kinase/phosphatase C-terminal domain-containing protein [Sphingosinicella ginsenosidimutans]|uniref:Aldolase n=1 Tax=Allosphingosinicella ginsenosidimutans TaxID=1176539 RepID=A0A5C6TV95_9SPHN|nr:HPr kinase/phosphatase C-terminal domain-containing protein [Sphingosinicella ginsenosidimutans]TXC64383.1 aldolase [Sphingosinicella ginsenosidimutans]
MKSPVLSSETVHASAVAIEGRAVLIAGRSGSGKSDLALRLIDRGAALVSDDYTFVRRADGRLLASAPDTIAGRIELRGVGIVEMANLRDVPVALYVDLELAPDRLPQEGERRPIAGIAIPLIGLAPFEASAPLKVEAALRLVGLPD